LTALTRLTLLTALTADLVDEIDEAQRLHPFGCSISVHECSSAVELCAALPPPPP
jgi:hypothetical protein